MSQKLRRLYFDFTHLFFNPTASTGIQRVIRNLYLNLLSIEDGGHIQLVPVVYSRYHDQFVEVDPSRIFHFRQSSSRRSSRSQVLTHLTAKLANSIARLPLFTSFLNPLRRRILRTLRTVRFLACSRPITPSVGQYFFTADTPWDLAAPYWACVDRLKSSGVSTAACFYDGLPWFHPEFFEERAVNLWKMYYTRSFRSVDSWFAISSVSQLQLLEISTQVKLPIRTSFKLPMGSDFILRPPMLCQSSSSSNEINVLAVSSLDARKGYDTLLRSIPYIDPSISITVVGRIIGKNSKRIYSELLEASRSYPNLSLLTDVGDDNLDILYKNCTAVICPSKAEGFGLSLIEAAQYGKTIISNDIPIFREVSSDYGLSPWFYPTNSSAHLARLINQLKTTSQSMPIQSSLTDVSTYTWLSSAEFLLEALFTA